MTSEDFERVHTVTDWWDGPREGIADFHGEPHIYQCQFDEIEDDWSRTLLLTPVDEETLRLALEDWAIWTRWERAFHEGRTTQATHPALPEDRQRRQEIEVILEGRLTVDPSTAVRVAGEFRGRKNTNAYPGIRSLEVKWTVVDGGTAEHQMIRGRYE
jgi:hypothetical protein